GAEFFIGLGHDLYLFITSKHCQAQRIANMDDSDKIIRGGVVTVPTMEIADKKKSRWFDVLLRRLPERNMTRPELIRRVSARLHVADSTVYAWLNGGREVTPEELKTVIREAGFTVSEILQEDVYYLRDKEERALVDVFRSMSESERAVFLRMIGGMESHPGSPKNKPE
ncbi:MAG: hypothetical protein Q7N50_15875, partial [Armatimonadota bacterium]|nr:hypothetical protein [Armatimonadota bacterium]